MTNIKHYECSGVMMDVARHDDCEQWVTAADFHKTEIERDALKAEVNRWSSLWRKAISAGARTEEQRDTLQSELTKARELLHEALQIDEKPDLWLRVKAFLEHQSASAAKDESDGESDQSMSEVQE